MNTDDTDLKKEIMTADSDYKYSALTETIIGVFYDVYNELGSVFWSPFIAEHWHLRFAIRGLLLRRKYQCQSFFVVGTLVILRADLVINDVVLLELKTAECIVAAHESQVINYLRATHLELGLVLNFGPKPQVRRLLLDNARKHKNKHLTTDLHG